MRSCCASAGISPSTRRTRRARVAAQSRNASPVAMAIATPSAMKVLPSPRGPNTMFSDLVVSQGPRTFSRGGQFHRQQLTGRDRAQRHGTLPLPRCGNSGDAHDHAPPPTQLRRRDAVERPCQSSSASSGGLHFKVLKQATNSAASSASLAGRCLNNLPANLATLAWGGALVNARGGQLGPFFRRVTLWPLPPARSRRSRSQEGASAMWAPQSLDHL